MSFTLLDTGPCLFITCTIPNVEIVLVQFVNIVLIVTDVTELNDHVFIMNKLVPTNVLFHTGLGWLKGYRWLSVRLQYLQHISNGDTAVLH